jgi:hypothetical protein
MGIGLTLIVIFVVVWIVTNVIRAQQDAAQATRRTVNRPSGNRPSGAANSRVPEKTSSSDIDRFLQEIDRLRKKNQDQPASESQPKPSAPRPQKQPEPLRTREQPPRRVPPERKKPTSERKPARPVSPTSSVSGPASVPGVTPTARPPRVSPIEQSRPEVQPVRPVADPKQPSLVRPAAEPKQPGIAEPAQPLTAPLQILKGLFKSGEGMAAAILLHEILADPKCRRRPGPA